MLKIQNFSKVYDGKPAVDNLSLEVEAGDIYAFIGHNGAGKTTTIKACCGILQFEQGDIFINGLSIKESPIECKRQMAYIPDNPELYEYLSGIKYLNFVADIYGVGVPVPGTFPSALPSTVPRFASFVRRTRLPSEPMPRT